MKHERGDHHFDSDDRRTRVDRRDDPSRRGFRERLSDRVRLQRRPGLRSIVPWLLFVSGTVLVGLWGLAMLDTNLYQRQQSAALERAIATRAALIGENASAIDFGRAEAARAAADAGGLIGRIQATRLGVSAIIAEGIDKRTLRRAVGHIPGTAFPGEVGNVGLAGHRDSFFRGLKDVCPSDSLRVLTPDGDFQYIVESTEIVGPERGDVLSPDGGATLTLVTCYPFHYVGNAPSRFIVRARLIGANRPYAPLPPEKEYTPAELTSAGEAAGDEPPIEAAEGLEARFAGTAGSVFVQ